MSYCEKMPCKADQTCINLANSSSCT
jgi:hypothetical protein